MSRVIPAVIPISRRQLDSMLERFAEFTDVCQIDIVDGIFARPPSWPFTLTHGLDEVLRGLVFDACAVELDLMVKDPEKTLDLWLNTKPARIIVHVESTGNLNDILAHAGSHAYQLGLAFNNETSLDVLKKIDMSAVDFVQLMGIATIGVQGEPFDERVLERIKRVKTLYASLPISIDGGVTRETLPRLKKAGADRFVSGSTILRAEDPKTAFEALLALAERA